eukprot:2186032-Rhodomonas_salina.1
MRAYGASLKTSRLTRRMQLKLLKRNYSFTLGLFMISGFVRFSFAGERAELANGRGYSCSCCSDVLGWSFRTSEIGVTTFEECGWQQESLLRRNSSLH